MNISIRVGCYNKMSFSFGNYLKKNNRCIALNYGGLGLEMKTSVDLGSGGGSFLVDGGLCYVSSCVRAKGEHSFL